MIPLSMVLQAYTPQTHLGDWQIVVFVNRRWGRILVERFHSSEKACQPMENSDQVLRIDTGIRAFLRQMPVLAAALGDIQAADMSDEEVIRAVFLVLASVYQAAPDRLDADAESRLECECANFLEQRERAALMALA